MITDGSNTYSVSVPISSSQQTWDYSVSGVPEGTYDVSLSYPTLSAGFDAEYWLNGSATHY